METAEGWIEYGLTFIKEFGPKLLAAIFILIIGLWIIRKLVNATGRMMSKSNYDLSLQKFLLNLVSWALKIFLIIVVISTVGVDVTTFAAVIAAAGLAIGLALQGSLANFAGGVLILIFKPYKIGDLIEAQGEIGVVKEIEIFTTKLVSPDSKLIIIPNGEMANGNITNYTAEGKIRVDLGVGIGYDDDIRKAKEVLTTVLEQHPLVLNEPKPTVEVIELGESSINLAIRPFCKPENYWRVYFDVTENTKYALDKAGIEIPYPHSVELQKDI